MLESATTDVAELHECAAFVAALSPFVGLGARAAGSTAPTDDTRTLTTALGSRRAIPQRPSLDPPTTWPWPPPTGTATERRRANARRQTGGSGRGGRRRGVSGIGWGGAGG